MIDKNCNVKGRATQVLLINSSKKGTPGIQIQFSVTDGEYANQSVRWDGWLTDETAERTIESLQHCGWQGDDLGEFADQKLHGLDKNEVELVVEMEEYQGEDEKYVGKSFPRVRWVNRLGGRGLNVEQAMKPADAAAFGQRFKGLVLKTKAKSTNGAGSGTDFPHGASAPPTAASGEKRF